MLHAFSVNDHIDGVEQEDEHWQNEKQEQVVLPDTNQNGDEESGLHQKCHSYEQTLADPQDGADLSFGHFFLSFKKFLFFNLSRMKWSVT